MGSKWFLKIENEDVARGMTKQGFYGALGMAAMTLLGLALIYYTNQSVTDRSALSDEDVFFGIIGGLIFVVPLQLFMAYRILKGKGWLASILLILWFGVEVVSKVLGGTANVGFFFFYLVLIVCLVNGFRGCL